MASTIVNVPCNIGAIINQSFNYVPITIKARPRRNLTVRASRETQNEAVIERTGLSIEECEAAVVAGKAPQAPPVPPKIEAPAGTPSVSFQISRRPRRNRKSPAMRASFQETSLSPANFVYPLFIHEGEEDTPIGAMPGCYRLGWRYGLVEEVAKARDVGVNSIVLFPKVPDALKVIYTDVALDPYSLDGHDGSQRRW